MNFISLGSDRGAVPQGDKKYYTGKGVTLTCLMSIILAKVDGNFIRKIFDLDEHKDHFFRDFEYYLDDEFKIHYLDNGADITDDLEKGLGVVETLGCAGG